jgi:hypothetical protein
MRIAVAVAILIGSVFVSPGCGPRKSYDGPTVDAFRGRLLCNGEPVSFAPNEKVTLKLFHEKGESYGVRIQADGSFQIGWMPIGKYSATLIREKEQGPAERYTISGGLTIEDGKTQYAIELGKGWKG